MIVHEWILKAIVQWPASRRDQGQELTDSLFFVRNTKKLTQFGLFQEARPTGKPFCILSSSSTCVQQTLRSILPPHTEHRLTAPQLNSTTAAFLKFNRHLLSICRLQIAVENQYLLQMLSWSQDFKSDLRKRLIYVESHLAFE